VVKRKVRPRGFDVSFAFSLLERRMVRLPFRMPFGDTFTFGLLLMTVASGKDVSEMQLLTMSGLMRSPKTL
jgi:hypothetical protein